MQIKGSCHCGAVGYTVETRTPYPYMQCFCSICRKTAGAAFTINIMALANTLKVTGDDKLTIYQAKKSETESHEGDGLSPAKRHFCSQCGSFLWVADPRWAQWVYPFASSVDTPLPTPPERVAIMLDFKAPWADEPDDSLQHPRYPVESIEAWHKRHGLYEDETDEK